MVSFTGIPSYMVDDCWDELEPLIMLPLERTGAIADFLASDILAGIKAGTMQCWAVRDDSKIIAAIVTHAITTPQRKILNVWLVGGSRMNEWVDKVWLSLKEYGRDTGCTAARGFGRKGWIRRLEDDIDYSVMWSVDL